MSKNTEIQPLSDDFDYSAVPSWYTICINATCPLHENCMRYLAGSNAPEDVESASCVMPRALKDGKCRWFSQIRVITMAAGFTHLYDNVLKKDFTRLRKSITSYLHGAKLYYQYMRGERPLSPEQQKGIQSIMEQGGYPGETVFNRYYESYLFERNPSI